MIMLLQSYFGMDGRVTAVPFETPILEKALNLTLTYVSSRHHLRNSKDDALGNKPV
jgi:hypothetical protein